MDVVTLETADEAEKFLDVCKKNHQLLGPLAHVGAISMEGKSVDKWYWVKSGKQIEYPIKFLPNEPNFYNNSEFCLAVAKDSKNDFFFSDVNCKAELQNPHEFKFICERTSDRVCVTVPQLVD